jgi:hypothetical protein
MSQSTEQGNKLDRVVARAESQASKLDDIRLTINGHLTALVESKVAVGKLLGIAEEQSRANKEKSLILLANTEAMRIVSARETAAVRKPEETKPEETKPEE